MNKPGLGAVMKTGPISGPTPGRADVVPVDVPAGSYVIPADVVSALGQGNTAAGHKKLDQYFPRRSIPAPRRKANGGIVPIAASDGEHVLDPEQVEAAGGPDFLDRLVKTIRAEYRRHLGKLPGPRR
jgi:hypothetical protein